MILSGRGWSPMGGDMQMSHTDTPEHFLGDRCEVEGGVAWGSLWGHG